MAGEYQAVARIVGAIMKYVGISKARHPDQRKPEEREQYRSSDRRRARRGVNLLNS